MSISTRTTSATWRSATGKVPAPLCSKMLALHAGLLVTVVMMGVSVVLQMREKINTNCYKFKIKDGSFITLRSRWFSFMNPWTKEVEYIVSTNTVVS